MANIEGYGMRIISEDQRPPSLPWGRSTIMRLLVLMRPFWRGMILAIVLGALTILSSIGLMATSTWLISKSALRPSIADLGVSVVLVRFLGISRGVFRYLERLVAHDTTFRILARLRVIFYSALEPLAPARLSEHHSGDLLAGVIADVDTLQDVYLRVIAPPAAALVVGWITVILYAAFDPFLGLIVLSGLILIGVGLPLITYSMGLRPGKARIEVRAQLQATLVDGIQGMAESLLYGLTHLQDQKLDTYSQSLARSERAMGRIDGLQSALTVLIVNGTAIAVLAAAINRVEGITLAALTLACTAAFEAVTPLGAAAAHLGGALDAARHLFTTVEAAPAVIESPTPVPLPQDHSVRFERVTFAYRPTEAPVLKRFNLDVPAGDKVAILGQSGAGKSTLTHLLARFWEVTEGQISLGGIDIRALGLTDLRQQIGVMSQQAHLFNTSLYENIRIGLEGAADDQVSQAADQAGLHDLIRHLPEGGDTLVGERGARLSGGERQRVALARVLLKNAPIWVLDEPTAHLDAQTERSLFETILQKLSGRTLILLTHRRIMLDRMDRVYWLQEGQLQAFEG